MDAIMMHAETASQARGEQEPATQLALRYFECLPRPTLLLRASGEIERSNAAARALLHERHCLCIACGRVVGFCGEASEGFEDALERAVAGRVSRVVISGPGDGGPMWQVELAPLQIDPAPPADLLLMLTVHVPVRPERGILALARIFRLTCAEARVLAQLADDRTPAEISAALGVSLTTVRTHLQSLYQKTGARRQPELVRLAFLAASS